MRRPAVVDLDVASTEFEALGTTARVVVTDPLTLEVAVELLRRQLDELDRACSRFRSDSELSRLNSACGHAVRVGPLLLEALETALRAASLTDGVVDPTVGEAIIRAGYDRDFAAVPPVGSPVVLPSCAVPGFRLVRVDRVSSVAQIPSTVRLDLGATAKALGADHAATAIAEQLTTGVLVSLGGDVAVAGEPPRGGWRVRVTDEHAAGSEVDGETITIASGGVATSSITVRSWRRGHEVMHHVIDPATGRPARGCWRTVSVAARSCVDANIASTAAIVFGERASSWLSSSGLPARLVTHDGRAIRVGAWPSPESQ
jgi:thiamine biosynthesis lipoprotein